MCVATDISPVSAIRCQCEWGSSSRAHAHHPLIGHIAIHHAFPHHLQLTEHRRCAHAVDAQRRPVARRRHRGKECARCDHLGQRGGDDPIPGMQYFFRGGANARNAQNATTPVRERVAEPESLAGSPAALQTPIGSDAIVDSPEPPPAAQPSAAVASDAVRKRAHEILEAKATAANKKKNTRHVKKTPGPLTEDEDDRAGDGEGYEENDELEEDEEGADDVSRGPCKKPAAHSSVSRKPAAQRKPAAAEKDAKVNVQHAFPQFLLKADAMAKSRGAYTSRAYDNVKKSHGIDRAREAYQYAARLWDAVNAA